MTKIYRNITSPLIEERYSLVVQILPSYNGVPMMIYEEWCKPDEVFSSDSCLEGCGGFGQGRFSTLPFLKISRKPITIQIFWNFIPL